MISLITRLLKRRASKVCTLGILSLFYANSACSVDFDKFSAFIASKKYVEALDWLNHLQESSPTDPNIISSKGFTLLLMREYQSALREIDQGLQSSNQIDLVYDKASILSAMGKHKKAIDVCNSLLNSDKNKDKIYPEYQLEDPNYFLCFPLIIGSFIELKSPEKALPYADTLISRFGNNSGNVEFRIITLIEMAEYQKALAEIESALSLSSIKDTSLLAYLYTLRAKVYRITDKLRKSQSAIQTALRIAKDTQDRSSFNDAYTELGYIFLAEGNEAKAMSSFNHAIDVFGDDAYIAYLERGKLRQKMNKVQLAISDYQKVLNATFFGNRHHQEAKELLDKMLNNQ